MRALPRRQAWLESLASLPALRTLSLSNCSIASLEGCARTRACTHAICPPALNPAPPLACVSASFPSLPALRKLYLSDNRIPGGLAGLAAAAPALELLDLSNNKLAAVDALSPLAALQQLGALDLGGCPVAESDAAKEEAYRAAAFALLPKLTWLDGRNRAGEEGCVHLVAAVAAALLRMCLSALPCVRRRNAQHALMPGVPCVAAARRRTTTMRRTRRTRRVDAASAASASLCACGLRTDVCAPRRITILRSL